MNASTLQEYSTEQENFKSSSAFLLFRNGPVYFPPGFPSNATSVTQPVFPLRTPFAFFSLAWFILLFWISSSPLALWLKPSLFSLAVALPPDIFILSLFDQSIFFSPLISPDNHPLTRSKIRFATKFDSQKFQFFSHLLKPFFRYSPAIKNALSYPFF